MGNENKKSCIQSTFLKDLSIVIVEHNLRYAGDTTLMTESEEELKSLLMKVKEEIEKIG